MRCFDKVSNWLPACDCSTVIDSGFLSGGNFNRLLVDLLFAADTRWLGPPAVSQVFFIVIQQLVYVVYSLCRV